MKLKESLKCFNMGSLFVREDIADCLALCSVRHLVYSILDLLLEFLVPEIPEEDFQRSLLQTLSKSTEKLLA